MLTSRVILLSSKEEDELALIPARAFESPSHAQIRRKKGPIKGFLENREDLIWLPSAQGLEAER